MTALEMITYLTIGPLLMYWWMGRRLDRSVAAADRCAARRLAEQQRKSAHALDLLTSDYNNIRGDLRQAILVCEGLTIHAAQLSAENDTLRHRLAQTPGIVNAWKPKTERGQA
jgi:hypothetical protein